MSDHKELRALCLKFLDTHGEDYSGDVEHLAKGCFFLLEDIATLEARTVQMQSSIQELLDMLVLVPETMYPQLTVDPWGVLRFALSLCDSPIQEEINYHWLECTGTTLAKHKESEERG